MKRVQGAWPTAFVALAAVTAAIAASAAPSHRAAARAEERTCCVANPRHAGICEVTLGQDETCQDVLAYLNNASSVGKTYCGNTTIRGGWKQVACEE